VAGSAPAARPANWTPFAPHGWLSVGRAGSTLMLSFVGWEAVAPLTRRLADPRRSLPRITAISFAVTAVIYLALASAVIAVLGPHAATDAPIAALLRVALGTTGPYLAAGAAALLTLATVNAYLTGAAALAAHLRADAKEHVDGTAARAVEGSGHGHDRAFFGFVAAAGLIELAAESAGLLDPARMVTLPTALFLVVYIGSAASAARILGGPLRPAAAVACVASAVILAFCGLLAIFALLVAAASFAATRDRLRPPARAHDTGRDGADSGTLSPSRALRSR